MATLNRRCTVRLADGTELRQWCDQRDLAASRETREETMVTPAETGAWTGRLPDHRAVVDPNQWELLDTNGDRSFGPWTGGPLTGIFVRSQGFPGRGSERFSAFVIRITRAVFGLQQDPDQHMREGWPVIIEWQDAQAGSGSYTGYVVRGTADTAQYFEFLLVDINDLVPGPTDDDPLNFYWTGPVSITARRRAFRAPTPDPASYVVTPFTIPAGATTTSELRTTEFANRSFRVRFDRRIAAGSVVTDEDGAGWRVEDVREVLTRRGFMDVYAKREIGVSDALVRTSSRTIRTEG